ncbi:hypothetical protein PG996_007530 [Apiospora saccharicola]|uniref:Uncharacterized protein n=1 Tax=Apiospora saccharicola TaxID=335842 RepID=A0ABR1VER2_9PEZI
MYGATKLPEDQYCFATAAGQVLVRALALADYRYAQNYVVDRLNQMITNYFKRMVTWKSIPEHPLRDDTYKLFLHDINDTYIAYMRTMTLPLMASRVLKSRREEMHDVSKTLAAELGSPLDDWENQISDLLGTKLADRSWAFPGSLGGHYWGHAFPPKPPELGAKFFAKAWAKPQ